MEKANLQFGALSKQEITLKDLTYGEVIDENVFEFWNLHNNEKNGMVISDLKLSHVYRPSIRIFADLSNSQKLIHECEEADFRCDFWTCKNNETIPASTVCNGTEFTGCLDLMPRYMMVKFCFSS